jgi:hypothetical protein
MCPSEVSTHTSLKAFLQGVLQIHNPILSNLKITFSTPPYILSSQLRKDVEFLQKLICVVGHVSTLFERFSFYLRVSFTIDMQVTRVVPFKRPYGEYIQVVFGELVSYCI